MIFVTATNYEKKIQEYCINRMNKIIALALRAKSAKKEYYEFYMAYNEVRKIANSIIETNFLDLDTIIEGVTE